MVDVKEVNFSLWVKRTYKERKKMCLASIENLIIIKVKTTSFVGPITGPVYDNLSYVEDPTFIP